MMVAPTLLDDVVHALRSIDDLELDRDVPAGPFCTYRVGGPLAVVATAHAPDAAVALAQVLAAHSIPRLALGNGSNLLVADGGFAGVAIRLAGSLSDIEIDAATPTRMTAGAAALLPRAARASVAAGLSGFEWAVGVPGTIGGAVRMNAGGHGSDMAASVRSIDHLDLATGIRTERSADELDFAYRHSNLGADDLVLAATLDLETGDREAGEQTLREIVSWRRSNQPGGANAGSVFTNPDGDSAGRLIDESGAKGHRIGSAEVSTKHANFIQADDGGSADDVMALMRHLVDLVDARHGVRLHAETRLVGFTEDDVAHVQSGEPS